MIDHIRYFYGLVHIVVIPSGVLYWLIIHPWASWWRKCGPIRTYLAVLPPLVGLSVLLFQMRVKLLGADFGTNRSLTAIAIVLWCLMISLELQYWRHLSISTLVGIQELSTAGKGTLLRGGIYGVVRHPRYLSSGIGLLASSLFINYLGLYILAILVVPLGYFLLILEERELVDRFGDSYRGYQRDVPQLIPRWTTVFGKRRKNERSC